MDDVHELLEDVGLTEYQSRAYVAAVDLGSAPLPDLAEEAGIPQQRIYDVVDDLGRHGLVEVHEGAAGKRAVAVRPEQSLGELKRQRIDRLESTVDEAVDALADRFGEVDTANGSVTVLTSESSIRRHAAAAIDEAEWWLFLAMPLDHFEEFEPAVRDAVDRGVTVRLLVEPAEGRSLDREEFPSGTTVRTRPAPEHLVVADRSYGLYRGRDPTSERRSALVTRDPDVVGMYQRYSELFWAGSPEVQTDATLPRRYLEPWRVLADVGDRLDDEPLEATVEGVETATGDAGTWTGPVVDTRREGGSREGTALPEIAQLVLETDEGRVTVGGWDATVEDVAASGIEIREP